MTWKSMAPLWVMLGGFAVLYAVDRRHRAEESDRVRAQLQLLAESVNRPSSTTERVVVTRPIYVNAAPTGAPSSSSESPSDSPPPLGKAHERPVLRLEQVEAKFTEEARNGAASSRGEAALRHGVESFIADSSAIESIECRTTLCRMQLSHASVKTSNRLIEQLFIGPEASIHGAQFFASDVEPTGDGRVRVAIMVPRAALPDAR